MSKFHREYGNHYGGLIQSLPGRMLSASFTPEAINVQITRDGRLQLPRLGQTRFSNAQVSVGDEVTGLFWMRRRDQTWGIVAIAGDQISEILATGAVNNLTTFTAGVGKPWSAVNYLGRLFMVNGFEAPKVYETVVEDWLDMEDASFPDAWSEGNYPSNISMIAAGRNERLVAWGFREDPSRAYFSALQDFLDWTDESNAFSLAVREDDGERIVAVVEFHDHVLMMKETKSVIYSGLDPTIGAAQNMRTIPYGCVSPRSVVKLENDVYWMSQDGPMSLKAVEQFGDVAGEIMATRIQGVTREISPNFRSKIVGIFDTRFQRLSWFYPTRQAVKNQKRLDLYIERVTKDPMGFIQGAWMLSDNMEVAAAFEISTAGGPMILSGGYDGWINQQNAGRDDFGSGIAASYLFPVADYKAPVLHAEVDFLIRKGGGALTAGTAVDDRDFITLAGDLSPSFPGDAPPAISRKVLTGQGRRLQLRIDFDTTAGIKYGEVDHVLLEAQTRKVR